MRLNKPDQPSVIGLIQLSNSDVSERRLESGTDVSLVRKLIMMGLVSLGSLRSMNTMSPRPNFRTDWGTRQIPPAAATNPSHRLFVEAGLARVSRPDWHGLVGVTRSLHAAICRAHRLHGPNAQSRAARMTRTAISRRFDENLGNRHRRDSDLKDVQRLPRYRRVLVLDLEQDTCLFGDDGRRDFMTSIRPTVSPTPTGSPGP